MKLFLAYLISLLIFALLGQAVFAGNKHRSFVSNGNSNVNKLCTNENTNVNENVNQPVVNTNTNLNVNAPINANTPPPVVVVPPVVQTPPPPPTVAAPVVAPAAPVAKVKPARISPQAAEVLPETGPSRVDWFLIVGGALLMACGVRMWLIIRNENKII